jgi:hypothetical protein
LYSRSSSTLPAISMEERSVTGSAGNQPASFIAHNTSRSLPISPILMGSPGMPCAVRVTIGKLASPRWCS